jgi:uncharacterized iron-regulated membrane protein
MLISHSNVSRRVWRQVHLWIGLTLGVLIVPIGVSGIVLVFSTDVDRLLAPSRYAVTGAAAEQPAGVYLANASAVASGARVAALRWPQEDGAPLTVALRGGAFPDQARLAYLDPPTGRVLGVADQLSSVIGIAHSLHANLLVPDFCGRQIVGWVGVGLLTMVLTGLWIWWRRSVGLLKLLRWRRGLKLSFNLHHMLGFWIAAPLGVMALTGAYLGFPQQARTLIGFFAELTPQTPRPASGGGAMRPPALDPQLVIELALQSGEGLRPVSLTPPTAQTRVWRIQMAKRDGELQAAFVDDATSALTISPATQGDAFLIWLRRVHEGGYHGPLWRSIVVICGVSPTFLFVTGALMWLRRRPTTSAAPSPAMSGDPQTSNQL